MRTLLNPPKKSIRQLGLLVILFVFSARCIAQNKSSAWCISEQRHTSLGTQWFKQSLASQAPLSENNPSPSSKHWYAGIEGFCLQNPEVRVRHVEVMDIQGRVLMRMAQPDRQCIPFQGQEGKIYFIRWLEEYTFRSEKVIR